MKKTACHSDMRFLRKKECAIGTFSRRGAVALATIYHCAECASLQALLAFME